MKKKILLSVFTLAVVTLTAFTGYKAFGPQKTLADLILDENIEALSSGENSNTGSECGGSSVYAISEYTQGKQKLRFHVSNNIDNTIEVSYKRCSAYGRGDIQGMNGTTDMSSGKEEFVECQGEAYHKYVID